MQRILKTCRDGRFAVIPAQAGIQTGPRIGVRGDGVIAAAQTQFLAIAIDCVVHNT